MGVPPGAYTSSVELPRPCQVPPQIQARPRRMPNPELYILTENIRIIYLFFIYFFFFATNSVMNRKREKNKICFLNIEISFLNILTLKKKIKIND